jgi:phosphatidate cytidylyltransferase
MTASTEATPPAKKSDLGPRLVTAVIGVPALLGILFLLPAWVFGVFMHAVVFVAAWEYFEMVSGKARLGLKLLTCLISVGVAALVYWGSAAGSLDGVAVLLGVCGAAMALFLMHLFQFEEIEKTSLDIGGGITAVVYCGLMPITLALLQRDAGEKGPLWVIMAMAVIWGSDSGAYFAGRAFGKRKLAPRVSPKKSVEGAVGGLLASVLAVTIFKVAGWIELAWWEVLALSVPANILGQLGDLAESLIKRAHGIKDSGFIIYGHGGILDRADALIFAAPWFYLFYRYVV